MGEKFNIIYADPPWKFQTYSERGSQLKSADCHYSCMKFDDILSLPVESIAADDSILFLWVTFPLLKEGLEVMKAWGFTYKTCGFNWVKRNKKADSWFMGLGYWTRSNSEICLLGTRGHPSRVSRSICAPSGARFQRVQVPNPPGSGKDIAEGKGVHREVESEGSWIWGTY
ncbi:MAG: MT-A70 family methyltransferase [Agathobacter sp.]|nr:MT-A70 family methyltransferase [Agathobacter sp.]